MGQAPLTTRDIRSRAARKGSDELRSLKRRVVGLARLEREVVHLAGLGPALVRVRRFRDAGHLVRALRRREALDLALLQETADLESPPLPMAPATFASLEHDLAVIATRPMRALAREHRRAFLRYGDLDAAWIESKATRLAALRRITPPARWTDVVVELVAAHRGAEQAERAARHFALLAATPAERRAKALERVVAIATAMETGEAPEEIRPLYERLDAAREFPGRARKRRTLDVLRRAIGWAELPAKILDEGEDLVAAGKRALALWREEPDDTAAERFAIAALAYRIDDVVPSLEKVAPGDLFLLRHRDLTIEQVATLSTLARPCGAVVKGNLAGHLAAGLELELLRAASENKQLEAVATLEDVRSARAFITWSTRLADHYKKHGLTLEISPQLFRSLPKNEDLTVLTLCLLDQHAEPTSDPIGTLDATLGLFQRLPAKARALLDELRRAAPGEGRRIDPELARWLDDDALLDRSIHIATLAGEPAISAVLRSDLERTARRARERAHLAGLGDRSPLQQRRLDGLLAPDVPAGRERTIRRLRARIERLLPRAYRRALDETFRRLLREGWGIRLPKLTASWREAVRFWLLVDDNRALLEKLLREASLRPGRSVKDTFVKNDAWLASMRDKIDVEAWLAPRRKEIEHAGARYEVALEEDPLEVLRMGIPFGTCLALDSGSNAASTVLNAIDANKRVLYVRNAMGKIVARKLLGVTDAGRLVGYRLYRSVGGEEERAIQTAVSAFCAELAAACRTPVTVASSPRRIHDGFWYNDGEVPFDAETSALPAFCEAHGLTAPASLSNDALQLEVEAWQARTTNDVDLGLRVLESSSDSPAMRVHDRWIIGRLGLRRALRAASSDGAIAYALYHSVAVDEPGLLLAMHLATRLPERVSQHRLVPILRRFPPSPRTNVALVDLALRSMRTRGAPDKRGHAYLTLWELPSRFEDVAGALDLLDAIEPAWRWLEQLEGGPKIVEAATRRAVSAIEAIYESTPEPDVVVTTLMSRRRGALAHRAALHVAARHRLTDGARALQRFAALEPAMMTTGDGLAALLRQSNGAIAAAPVPKESPFDALRELVALPDIHRFLGPWDTLEGEPKGTWEAAWRRRRRHDPPGGYDAVLVERARKTLVDPNTAGPERDAARTLVLGAKDGEVVDWLRLVASAARIGDEETARHVLEEILSSGKPFTLSPRTIVDLWRLGEATRALVVRSFASKPTDDWSSYVQAAEREAAARGVALTGMLEAIALAMVGSPSEVVDPNTTEQLERVLGAIVHGATPMEIATVFVNLEDALSVVVFRDALAREPAERVAAIKAEMRKLDLGSDRTKTFFGWIRDIGGIENS